jgi:hypothetical protein
MRKNRKALFLHSDIVRGRYLKQDAAAGGGATPDAGGANADTGAGNSSAPASGESSDNNTGNSFDANAFWGGSAPDESGSSDSESASGDQSGSGTEFKEQLTQQLNNLNFGDPIMTPETMEAMQNGDFKGFNEGIQKMVAHGVRQSLGLAVSVLRPFADQIMTDVEDRISQRLGTRDDADQLLTDFPAAKDPKIRPVVENLYKQALKNTKGDRPAAVEQVKSMMRLVSTSVADDLGLNVAPRGPDDSGRPTTSVNWLDELSARN